MHATWVLGGEFLDNSCDTFKNMESQAKEDGKRPPYLFDNYNMEFLVPEFDENVPAKDPNETDDEYLGDVYNALVAALNDEANIHLPRYLILILDADLIQAANIYDYGAVEAFEDNLKWLLINISEGIELRKKDLIYKRHGAVLTNTEPWLIWVTMLRRPGNTTWKEIFSLTRKFNLTLENVIARDPRSHILKVHVDGNGEFFTDDGNFTEAGLAQYWRSVDAEMADFDHGKTDLQPIKFRQDKISRPPKNSRYRWHKSATYLAVDT